MRQGGFVVQFGAQTDLARRRFVGRVEHIASGRAARFQSSRALLAFIRRMLALASARGPTPRDAPQGRRLTNGPLRPRASRPVG